ncbi:NUT family member 2G-like [Choloepus didactylus]|uniref:NUT family member 2G-like n=1 Tax=Choloepus didactylus TaxID=27675 RepID=UPI00189DADA6|nr:NUT family member 2G-like [Choloepus didactylus]
MQNGQKNIPPPPTTVSDATFTLCACASLHLRPFMRVLPTDSFSGCRTRGACPKARPLASVRAHVRMRYQTAVASVHTCGGDIRRRTLLVTGDGGPVTRAPGADKVILQVRKQGGPAETPETQSVILPQTPHISSANGILCGGVNHPPPGNLRPSSLQPIMPAMTLRGTKPGNGGWSPGFPPQAPPPVTPLAPNVHSGNALPRTQGASGEGAVASAQSTPSLDDSCKPRSVYENFRCWQRFKSLAQRYFHWSPDAEALSCFLIPVLRSLARREPTMSLEDGLHRAVQEWQRTSNFDRMIYYEMARKFKEFETEEEGQIEILQKMSVPQGPLRTDPPKLHPLVQKGNVEGQQPEE